MTIDGHLDELALDAVRAGEASQDDQAHVASCAACRNAAADLEKLAARLRVSEPALRIPDEIDRAIVGRAVGELRQRRRRRAVVPWALAAAAGVAVAISIGVLNRPPARSVDMVDAYVLALRLSRGEKPEERWDRTRDGVVDRLDVEAIARESVSLSGRRP